MFVACDCGESNTFHVNIVMDRGPEDSPGLAITAEAVCTECEKRYPIGEDPTA